MSTTVSSTTPNPYAVAYSSSDLSGTDTTASKYATTSGSKSTGTSSNSSSGSYSQGLVSQMTGLDVSSLVNQSMASDVIKLNSLLAKQQKSQWVQDRYRSVISNLQDFTSKYFDSSSSNYIFSPDVFSVNAANSSNTTVLNTTASNLAKTGTYTVTSATLATTANITNPNTVTSRNLDAFFTLGLTGTISFNMNGSSTPVTYDLDANGYKTVSQVMSDLSNLTGANFSYSELTGKFNIASNSTGDNQKLNIYEASDAGSYTNASGTVNIQYNSSDASTSAFLSKLYNIGTGAGKTKDVSASGHNGTFTIKEPGDSNATTISQASNNFTIDGVSYSFSSSFDSTRAVAPDYPVSINVKQDVSSALGKIQGFVADYNNLVSGINAVTLEKSNSSYAPLTSTQESQMTASQITAWNQKAQQGLLQNDGSLTDMLSEMRAAFYTPVSGNGLTMGGIGLSTADDYNDASKRGQIQIDVKKLTTALQSNPQGVTDLFTKRSTSYLNYESALNVDTSTDSGAVGKAIAKRSSEEGIFQRLSDIEKKYAGTYVDKNGNQGILLSKAGSLDNEYSLTRNSLYKEIKGETDAVSDFKTRMALDEKMYNQKFSSLQAALSALSSQQNYLSSMLSSSSS